MTKAEELHAFLASVFNSQTSCSRCVQPPELLEDRDGQQSEASMIQGEIPATCYTTRTHRSLGPGQATGQTLRGCSVSRDGHGAGEGAAAPAGGAGGAQPGETGLGGDPIALRLPEGAGAGGSVSSPREPATGQEGTAPGCARGGSGGISGEIPSRKGWPGRGTGCPGTGCCHRPRGGSKPPQAPCLGTRFSGGLGSAGLGAGLDNPEGLFQAK